MKDSLPGKKPAILWSGKSKSGWLYRSALIIIKEKLNIFRARHAFVFLAMIVSTGLWVNVLTGGEMSAEEKINIYNTETGEVEEVYKVRKSDQQWKEILTEDEWRVTRKKVTERPFSHTFSIPEGENGVFRCVCCGTALFEAEKKFNSGTGWPSFTGPVSDINISLEPDNSLLMKRTEVLCARCDAHLGHVFDDGPPPTNKRYCINGTAIKYFPEKEAE